MNSLVSIILPTYNRAHLLPRAIQSVFDQQYESFQLIIIDDGSIDNTREVIAAIDDSRIHYVQFEENRGIGAARHEGVEHVRGKFIAFVDSDDLWLPGKLELQLRLFEAYSHLDLIFGNYININYMTNSRELGFDEARMKSSGLVVNSLEKGVWEILSGFQQAKLNYSFMATPTVMFRTELIERIGNFDQGLSGPEDFEFWWRLATHDAHFAYTEKPLIERHKDEQSITAQTIRFAPQYLRALDLCEQTSRQRDKNDLLPGLNMARRRTWIGLIRAYALEDQRLKALQCFAQSLRYGLSYRAIVYAAAALAGPNAIELGKRIKRRLSGIKLF